MEISQMYPCTNVKALAERTRAFIDTCIVPREVELAGPQEVARACHDELMARAREQGLWGLFHPGRLESLQDYLVIAEQEGRSEYGPAIFGADMTLDARMLSRHGNAEIHRKFLTPLLSGEAVSAYAMSEPDSIGSVPATLTTRAAMGSDSLCLDGRKWFICRADRACFYTVVARTAEGGLGDGLSMILVPAGLPGFSVARELDVLGSFHGQAELVFNAVRVPSTHVLGQPGGGLALMQERLQLGRLLRSAHWLGLAQRCFDLLCSRVSSVRGRQARLSDKQLVRLRTFDAYHSIAAARGLLRDAARQFDASVCNDIDVNVTKIAASRALSLVVDSAIQIYGAEGLSHLTPLSRIYRAARATHILDGTDDALISAVGRRLLEGGPVQDNQNVGWSISPVPHGNGNTGTVMGELDDI